MSEHVTMCFVVTKELKDLVEQWAEESDLNMSQVVRRILKREAQRRQQCQALEQKPANQQSN